MPRAYPPSHVCHGRMVGFNVKVRKNEPTYFVYFRSMDGRRLERDTNQTGMLRAVEAARAINAASGNRPLVVLANLSGFDGSP